MEHLWQWDVCCCLGGAAFQIGCVPICIHARTAVLLHVNWLVLSWKDFIIMFFTFSHPNDMTMCVVGCTFYVNKVSNWSVTPCRGVLRCISQLLENSGPIRITPLKLFRRIGIILMLRDESSIYSPAWHKHNFLLHVGCFHLACNVSKTSKQFMQF